ncbi:MULTISPECIES: GNAT family N-acetyltransferase [unclassified Microbacterium]|uniref:GNAT family N-acetyltransferase n=1 Tax=unclassified Microbacterium TaxID=2609290 RepID=UPI00386B8C32
MTESTTRVERNEAKSRYEIFVDDTVAGYTLIRGDENGRTVLPHTKIDPAYGGRGLGRLLIGEALADLAERGETAVPVCPFVVKYLRENDVPGLDVSWRPTADDAGIDVAD